MAKKGQKMLQRTQDQKRQLAKAIFNDYAQGMYSLVNCAKAHKVNIRTLNLWCSEDSAVAQFKKNAQDLIAAPDPDALKVKARVSLEKLITGYEYEEKTVDVETDSSGRIKQQKVRKVTKRVQPDTTAVIFTLKNTDPDNFNRGTNDIQTNSYRNIGVDFRFHQRLSRCRKFNRNYCYNQGSYPVSRGSLGGVLQLFGFLCG